MKNSERDASSGPKSPRASAAIGGWASSADPLVIELLAKAGFDFVGLDLQHGQFDYASASRALQVLELLGVRSLVRLSSEEIGTAPRYLDAGARGIMLATVEDAGMAERAVSLSRYQPTGRRSYGGARFGLGTESADTPPAEVWVMIETLAGVRKVKEIAQVPGLFGLSVGPADLSYAHGLPLDQRSSDTRWNGAVRSVLTAAREHGLSACQFVADGAEARHWIQVGFDHIVLSNDLSLLRTAAEAQLAQARS